ncbi:hypothetical protein SLEP1_g10850 [Rubroshorea leprosula]|uniref:Uncharacterized protein n=1 Tax=Rubroshorea leprosula TaxID=152421 RepID=A0AAV5IJE9_9ROSI|nr:hypothetical protein SLEP1_g10850 [Rubroshorea leprosula]
MESSAQRRLHAIQSHLLPSTAATADDRSLLFHNLASSNFFDGQGYSYYEKLQTGKWNVYRSGRSPMKLVSRFPDHPEIVTLHDNFV